MNSRHGLVLVVIAIAVVSIVQVAYASEDRRDDLYDDTQPCKWGYAGDCSGNQKCPDGSTCKKSLKSASEDFCCWNKPNKKNAKHLDRKVAKKAAAKPGKQTKSDQTGSSPSASTSPEISKNTGTKIPTSKTKQSYSDFKGAKALPADERKPPYSDNKKTIKAPTDEKISFNAGNSKAIKIPAEKKILTKSDNTGARRPPVDIGLSPKPRQTVQMSPSTDTKNPLYSDFYRAGIPEPDTGHQAISDNNRARHPVYVNNTVVYSPPTVLGSRPSTNFTVDNGPFVDTVNTQQKKTFPPGFCPYGSDGECSNHFGPFCRRGTTCKLMGSFKGAPGLCCIDTPGEERCPSGVLDQACSRLIDCKPGYTCRFGVCCKDLVCPKNWTEGNVCNLTPAGPKCQKGYQCIGDLCCRVPEIFCPSGILGDVCSKFAPCKPGYTCRFGFCCRDAVCPKDWIGGESCNTVPGQPKCKEGYECINNVCCRATLCPSGVIGPVCSAKEPCKPGYKCKSNYCCRESVCPKNWTAGSVCNLTPGEQKCQEGYQCIDGFCCRVPEIFCPSGVLGDVCSKFAPCKPGYTCRFGFCCRDAVCPKDWIGGESCNTVPGQPKCKDGYECINNVCCRATFCPSGVIGPVCSAKEPCKPGYKCKSNYCCRDPVCPKHWKGGNVCNLTPGEQKCQEGYQCIDGICCRMLEIFCPSGVLGDVCSKFAPCKPGYTCKFGYCCRDAVCPKDWIGGESCNTVPGQPKCKDGYECINNVCCRATFCPSGVIGPVCSAKEPCKPGYKCKSNYCCREPVCPKNWKGGNVCNLTPGEQRCQEGYQCIDGFCCRVPEIFCPSGVLGDVCSKFAPCKPGYTCRFGFCCRDAVCPKNWIGGESCNTVPGQPKCKEGYQCINNICCRATFCPSGSIGPVCSDLQPCKPGYSCRSNYCCREPLCPKGWFEGGVCNLTIGQPRCQPGFECNNDFCCKRPVPVPVCPDGSVGEGYCKRLQGQPRCNQGYVCINEVCCRQKEPQLPVCKQPKKIGPCEAAIPRWFYNYITKACEHFIYGGCQGNDNNFERKEDCQKRCGTIIPPNVPICKQPKVVGPCRGAIPRWFYNYKTKACEQFIYGGCQGNDNNFERKEDCEMRCGVVTPPQLPVCKQPKEIGPCLAAIPRWFYNFKTKACEHFIYGGCQGNDNNFERKEDCERRCGVVTPPQLPVCKQPKEIGPCLAAIPRWFYNYKTKACEHFIYGGCQGNDNNFERKEDCERRCGVVTPPQLPVCKQPKEIGPCLAAIPRWFYNYKTKACEHFIYGGCQGNDNNFERKEDCERRCGVVTPPQLPVCKQPKEIGPCLAAIPRWFYNYKTKACEHFIYGGCQGNDNNFERKEDCERRCGVVTPPQLPVCKQPKEIGPCLAAIPRWFYNYKTKACEHFIYGGCQGNDNNFERKEDCERRCGVVTPPQLPVCKQPKEIGPCLAAIPRWFYNYKTKACEHFIYGGCQGNDNNFERKEDCERRCGVVTPPQLPVCKQPKEIGPCLAAIPRWFYNFKTKACERFIYGGCQGNDNNFERKEDCERRCGVVTQPQLPVCKQPMKIGPCDGHFPRWYYNSKTKACEQFIFGGCEPNDNNFERKEDCDRRCSVQIEPQPPVCKQPKKVGPCDGHFHRWFYNSNTKACEQFIFGGCKPNDNNFERKEDCEGRCLVHIVPSLPVCQQPKEIGPCRAAIPRWFYNSATKACEKFIFGGCGGNDNNFERQADCERACGSVAPPKTPLCKQPKVVGPCRASIPRWFYNYKTKACEQFIYGGCQGNENNFERKEDCDRRCGVVTQPQLPVCKQPRIVGPCAAAFPRWFYNYKTKACEQFIYGGCQGNENNFGRKEDCEGRCGTVTPPNVPLCKQPKVVGPCRAAIPRWFYNYKTKACEHFIYGGCHGNDNNFERKEDCEGRCGVVTQPQLTVCKQPKKTGPCKAAIPRWFYNSKTKACEQFIYGGCQGNDNNFERKEDCEKRCGVVTVPQLPVCKQPKVVGPCRGAFPRWFYNSKTKSCEQFTYGGCQGNDNNFERKEDCEGRCGSLTPPQLPVCKQPKVVGPCRGAFPRWFYNNKTKVCEQFIYGGCQGNDNNFERKEDCERRCVVVIEPICGNQPSDGDCGGFVGKQCKPGYTCRYRPGSTIGTCCKNEIVTEPICGNQPSDGDCGGFVGKQCKPGYTCRYGPGSTLGTCCKNEIDLCISGVIGPSCSKREPCKPGYSCKNGVCCLDQVCPKGWIEGGSCKIFPGGDRCQEGFECINNFCCRSTFCPSGSIGPQCSKRKPCKPGYSCRGGNCCREPVCPAGWQEGGVCNLKPGEPFCAVGFECNNDFCCKRPDPIVCPSGEKGYPCQTNEQCKIGYECRNGNCCRSSVTNWYRK